MKLTLGDVLRIFFGIGEPKPSTYDEVKAANERADMLADILEERDEERRSDDRKWAEATGLPLDSEPTSTARAARTAGEALGRKPGETIYDAAFRVVKERDAEAIAAASMRDMANRTYRRVGEEAGVQGLLGASDAIGAVTALRVRAEKAEGELAEAREAAFDADSGQGEPPTLAETIRALRTKLAAAELELALTAPRKPVCSACNDTHMMQFGEREPVMCTYCPRPCQSCRAGGNGPYCLRTPCECHCHRASKHEGP